MTEKMFKIIIDHLFPIREKFHDRDDYDNGCWIDGDVFDYPDYGGLPKNISNRLSSEAVDAMQSIICNGFERKRDFAKAYKDRLEELGEKIRF